MTRANSLEIYQGDQGDQGVEIDLDADDSVVIVSVSRRNTRPLNDRELAIREIQLAELRRLAENERRPIKNCKG